MSTEILTKFAFTYIEPIIIHLCTNSYYNPVFLHAKKSQNLKAHSFNTVREQDKDHFPVLFRFHK